MDQAITARSDLALLRAIAELARDSSGDGAELTLPQLLERLLGCECVLTLAGETVRAVPPRHDDGGAATSQIVIQGITGGVVGGEIELVCEPSRPFDERDLVLLGLIRPHVASWLTRLGVARGAVAGATITQRQSEILSLVRCGLSNKEIATALGLSQATIHKHLENSFARLGAASRIAAVASAFDGGGFTSDAGGRTRHV